MQEFSAKLAVVLKALAISRGRLAADLGVDKSVVSRWMSGIYAPAGENLSALTRLVAARHPGFTGLDWDRDAASLVSLFGGVTPSAPQQSSGQVEDISELCHSRAQSKIEVDREGHAYPGIYASFRTVFRNTGDLLIELVVIWRDGTRLRFRQTDPSFSRVGEILIVRHQLFGMGEDDARIDGLAFYILNAVSGRIALRLDGIFSTVTGDRWRTPGATTVVLLRIADLPGATYPDEAILAPIAARMKRLYTDQQVATVAGPAIVSAIRPTVGVPRDDGGFDNILRVPMDRSLTASEVEYNSQLGADIARVRIATIADDPLTIALT